LFGSQTQINQKQKDGRTALVGQQVEVFSHTEKKHTAGSSVPAGEKVVIPAGEWLYLFPTPLSHLNVTAMMFSFGM
jgi:hypothetical protein